MTRTTKLEIDLDHCTDEEVQFLANRLPVGTKAPGIAWEVKPRVTRPNLFLRYLAERNGGAALELATPAPAPPEGPGVE